MVFVLWIRLDLIPRYEVEEGEDQIPLGKILLKLTIVSSFGGPVGRYLRYIL